VRRVKGRSTTSRNRRLPAHTGRLSPIGHRTIPFVVSPPPFDLEDLRRPLGGDGALVWPLNAQRRCVLATTEPVCGGSFIG
jgi:hypothetical protein